MDKKSFFLGVLAGIVVTLVSLFIIGQAKQNSSDSDSIKYLDEPLSYENKKETSFKVHLVLDNAALATEASDKIDDIVVVGDYGKTVMLLGENFYTDQIVTVKNPQRVGTYSYVNNAGAPVTVPVLDGEME